MSRVCRIRQKREPRKRRFRLVRGFIRTISMRLRSYISRYRKYAAKSVCTIRKFCTRGTELADYIPLYEAASLGNTRTEFMRLLGLTSIQKFIEDNPILLRQFPAEQILFKPPILTFYNADFAVLSPQRELILIEIETPETRLLKKDGDQAARYPCYRSGSTVTRCTGRTSGGSVGLNEDRCPNGREYKRGSNCGRDRGNDKDHLRRLKGMLSGRITFLTFDDLAGALLRLSNRCVGCSSGFHDGTRGRY